MDAQKKKEHKLLAVAGFAWLFDAMDVGLLSFLITALEKEWHLSEVQMGWIGSVSSIGMAVGALIFGMLADRMGRKIILIVTLLFFSIGSGLSALATGLTFFLIMRFFVGAGLGGELPVASTLVSENVAPKRRGRIVVLLESFWAGGWIVSAIVATVVIPRYGWRVAEVGTMLTAIYAIFMRLGMRDINEPTVIDKMQRLSFFASIREVWSKAYRRQTSMLWILWFTVVFSYYGMFLWLPSVMVMKGFDLVHSFSYVMIMTLAQLPGYFSAAWLIEKLGRKLVLISYLLGTALFAFLFGNAVSVFSLVTYGALLSFFNLGAWGVMYAYTPEQYPSVIRGTGTGMAASFGRIGGIIGPLLVGYLISNHVTVGHIFTLFCIAIVIGVIAVFWLGDETKGKILD
ncbi:MFS transporter [Dellaglioa sp. BT-FLS60]